MKLRKLVIPIIVLALLPLVILFAMSILSKAPTNLGVQPNGQLLACGESPNCVCSHEEQRPSHAVEALSYAHEDQQLVLATLSNAISEMGGRLVTEDDNYLHAEFTSRIFRYVDDVEILQDHANRQFHIRSASRAGHSDLGVNRTRVESLRQAFADAVEKLPTATPPANSTDATK